MYVYIYIYIVNMYISKHTYVDQCLVVPPSPLRDGDGPYLDLYKIVQVCVYLHV